MEAYLEAYLAKKGIEYEKFAKQHTYNVINHYYVLERFVEFDNTFNLMERIVDKNTLLGKDENAREYIRDYLEALDINNIKCKEVLQVADNYLVYLSVQYETEDIIFCFRYFNSLDYKQTNYEYEFRKFIKYNTIFNYGRFDNTINVLTDELGNVEIYNSYCKIRLIYSKNNIIFKQFQEFKDWLAENMPEYLKHDDIKIALKD
jgi:hypothetical protein